MTTETRPPYLEALRTMHPAYQIEVIRQLDGHTLPGRSSLQY